MENKVEDILRSGKWLPRYITFRNYISTGRGQIDFLINAGKNATYVLAIIFFLGVEIPKATQAKLFPLFVIINLTIFYVIGWVWDKIKGFDLSAEWNNIRNPMLKRIENKK